MSSTSKSRASIAELVNVLNEVDDKSSRLNEVSMLNHYMGISGDDSAMRTFFWHRAKLAKCGIIKSNEQEGKGKTAPKAKL